MWAKRVFYLFFISTAYSALTNFDQAVLDMIKGKMADGKNFGKWTAFAISDDKQMSNDRQDSTKPNSAFQRPNEVFGNGISTAKTPNDAFSPIVPNPTGFPSMPMSPNFRPTSTPFTQLGKGFEYNPINRVPFVPFMTRNSGQPNLFSNFGTPLQNAPPNMGSPEMTQNLPRISNVPNAEAFPHRTPQNTQNGAPLEVHQQFALPPFPVHSSTAKNMEMPTFPAPPSFITNQATNFASFFPNNRFENSRNLDDPLPGVGNMPVHVQDLTMAAKHAMSINPSFKDFMDQLKSNQRPVDKEMPIQPQIEEIRQYVSKQQGEQQKEEQEEKRRDEQQLPQEVKMYLNNNYKGDTENEGNERNDRNQQSSPKISFQGFSRR